MDIPVEITLRLKHNGAFYTCGKASLNSCSRFSFTLSNVQLIESHLPQTPMCAEVTIPEAGLLDYCLEGVFAGKFPAPNGGELWRFNVTVSPENTAVLEKLAEIQL